MTEVLTATQTFTLPAGLSQDERTEALSILNNPVEFIDCPEIRSKTAHINLFRKEINRDDAELVWYAILARDAFNSKDVKPSITTEMLLTREEERITFLQYNYSKLVVWRLQQKTKTNKLTPKEVRKLLLWYHIAGKIKSKLLVCNLGLIKSMISMRGVTRHPDADEFFEEADEGVLRAIELFDVKKGFKFSTYACRVIFQRINRALETSFKRNRFFVSTEVLSKNSESPEKAYVHGNNKFCQELDSNEKAQDIKYILEESLAGLSEVEARVIRYRFNMLKDEDYKDIEEILGTDIWQVERNNGYQQKYGGLNLEDIGKIIGVTKERTRQIQTNAFNKLREILEFRAKNGSELKIT